MQAKFNEEKLKQEKKILETAGTFGEANLAEDIETLAIETANALAETKVAMEGFLKLNKMLLEKI